MHAYICYRCIHTCTHMHAFTVICTYICFSGIKQAWLQVCKSIRPGTIQQNKTLWPGAVKIYTAPKTHIYAHTFTLCAFTSTDCNIHMSHTQTWYTCIHTCTHMHACVVICIYMCFPGMRQAWLQACTYTVKVWDLGQYSWVKHYDLKRLRYTKPLKHLHLCTFTCTNCDVHMLYMHTHVVHVYIHALTHACMHSHMHIHMFVRQTRLLVWDLGQFSRIKLRSEVVEI